MVNSASPPVPLVLSAVALFAIAVLGGSLALWFRSSRTKHDNYNNEPVSSTWSSSFVLNRANLFAGGVLLGVSVLHMLPDAIESSLGMMKAIAWYIAGCAFVVLLDQIVPHDHAHDHHDENSSGSENKTMPATNDIEQQQEQVHEATPLLSFSNAQEQERNSMGHEKSSGGLTESSSVASCQTCHSHSNDEVVEDVDTVYIELSSSNNQQQEELSKDTKTPQHPVSAMWSLWIALSLHSLLEGASLGAQSHNYLDLALGLFMHKGIVAFSVVMSSTSSSRASHRDSVSSCWFWLISFAIMTPLGIMMGWYWVARGSGTSSENDTDGPTAGVVAALAGGTFLYVAVFEMLLPAWQDVASKHSTSSVVQALVMVIVGMALVAVFAD